MNRISLKGQNLQRIKKKKKRVSKKEFPKKNFQKRISKKEFPKKSVQKSFELTKLTKNQTFEMINSLQIYKIYKNSLKRNDVDLQAISSNKLPKSQKVLF